MRNKTFCTCTNCDINLSGYLFIYCQVLPRSLAILIELFTKVFKRLRHMYPIFQLDPKRNGDDQFLYEKYDIFYKVVCCSNPRGLSSFISKPLCCFSIQWKVWSYPPINQIYLFEFDYKIEIEMVASIHSVG